MGRQRIQDLVKGVDRWKEGHFDFGNIEIQTELWTCRLRFRLSNPTECALGLEPRPDGARTWRGNHSNHKLFEHGAFFPVSVVVILASESVEKLLEKFSRPQAVRRQQSPRHTGSSFCPMAALLINLSEQQDPIQLRNTKSLARKDKSFLDCNQPTG